MSGWGVNESSCTSTRCVSIHSTARSTTARTDTSRAVAAPIDATLSIPASSIAAPISAKSDASWSSSRHVTHVARPSTVMAAPWSIQCFAGQSARCSARCRAEELAWPTPSRRIDASAA